MKVLFLLLLSLSLAAQKETSLINTYLQQESRLYGFNGNVLVAKKGEIIYENSFGYADYDTRKKLDSNSIFDCGSIAKEFTAVGILLLIDGGKITYTDTLRKFFPELPYTHITIQQLLTHTSGVPDGFNLVTKFFDHEKVASNDDLIRLLAREKPPVFFKPGENLAYSGTGFNLLASVIEKISGLSYKTYMAERVFKPLGMMHTLVSNGPRSGEDIPGYAYGYTYSDSLKKKVRSDSLGTGWTSYLSGITGEGVIITTTGDLLKWDRALKNNNLLTEKTQQAMLSVQSERSAVPKVRFGYGMRVGENEEGNYIFHNGYYPGYVSMHLRYTDEDVTAIVLSNNESHSEFIADALASIVLTGKIIMPSLHKEILKSPVFLIYAGKYMMPLTRPPYMVNFPIEFIYKAEKLYIHPTVGTDIELKPESATKFFYGDGTNQQIEFETYNGGQAVKVWYTAWGVKKEARNID